MDADSDDATLQSKMIFETILLKNFKCYLKFKGLHPCPYKPIVFQFAVDIAHFLADVTINSLVNVISWFVLQ